MTNSLFMLGGSFLLGGLKHHVQEFNRSTARLQAGLLFLASVALLIPSAISRADATPEALFTEKLSIGLSILLMLAYALGLLFSLKTHRDFFGSVAHAEDEEEHWPIGVALATLAVVTVLVALVSEVFVASVQDAALALGYDAGVRRLHRRGARRRGGRDGGGFLGRAQEPSRSRASASRSAAPRKSRCSSRRCSCCCRMLSVPRR